MSRQHVPETGWTPVHANGLTFACFDEGDGPLALLLHGFPDTPHTWDDLAPLLLAAGYRVVRPFQRGYAPSTRPEGDAYSQLDLGRDALALIEALGHDDAVVVGHDWGASAAYVAAAMAPDKVRKLVTLAIPHPGAVRPTPRLLWSARHFLTLKLPWAARDIARGDFSGVNRLYRRWSPTWDVPDSELEAVKNAFAAPGCLHAALGYYRSLSPRLPPELSTPIAAPTLCLYGADDAVDEAMYQSGQHLFTGGMTLQRTPGGHFLHREAPDVVLARIVEFLGPPIR